MNRDGDERDRALRINGGNLGLLAVLVFVLVWGQIQYFAWSEPCGNLYAVAFLGVGVASAYQYARCRRRVFFVSALVWFACAIIQMAGYLVDIGVVAL